MFVVAFPAIWLHDLIFLEFPPWVFTLGYTVFGLAVLGTLWLSPLGAKPKIPLDQVPSQ